MSNDLKKYNLKVILIQIDEAHSDAWPMNIKNQPKPQKSFEDRILRANQFIAEYNPPYPVYIDNWNNEFAELFRAWPDKYHCVNKDLEVIGRSEYGLYGDEEAKIIKDYTILLNELMFYLQNQK